MKILVTGGAGFIGRHLVRSLLKGKNEIIIYENFSNSTQNEIKGIKKNSVKIIKGDLTNFQLLKNSLKDVDNVIHLAANIDILESIKHPEKSHETNVIGSMNLLRASVINGVSGLVGASSAAIYGDPKTIPVNEKTVPNPVSPYGADKLSMEYYIKAFSNTYNLNSVSLRFFNVYGIGQSNSYAGVITKFMKKIQNNEPLTIFGDGKNTRDYVYIDDLIQGIEKSLKKIKGKRGDTYNIASGRSYSVTELSKILLSLYGKKLKIIYKSPRKGDLRFSKTSISLAKKELNYMPKYNLENGLSKMLDERN
jgi:UDP-glucose 4-epimerase